MRYFVAAIAVLLVACGDDPPPPVEVSNGRITAKIYPSPAGIALAVDGKDIWTTRRGGDGGPEHGFAATGVIDATIEMQFGSFKIVEGDSQWRGITQLGAITETATGATFTLLEGEREVGHGELAFVQATKSGANPDAAGFPRHVRITLAAETGEKLALSTPCHPDEHFVGLGGQSFDVDHKGQTVPLWVQEDGIGKFPDADDDYQGVWFLTGRRHTTHTPMPMMLSSRGYALAVDTDARPTFTLCSERPDSARFETWERELDLQIFVGDPDASPVTDALGHMLAWVGKPGRPPLHAFFPWVDAIYGQANVARIAAKLRANDIPASAIWTEDWRGGEETAATGYALKENWRVDEALYPNMTQLSSDLEDAGFAFLTYHNTFLDETADIYAEATGAGYAIHKEDGSMYSYTGIKFSPSTMLDLTNPQAYAWAKDILAEGLTLGADGWMADFAEWLPADAKLFSGEDPIKAHQNYPVQWAKLNHELLTPVGGIFFVRSAWLHSQPHVQIIWPGDQQTDWSDGDGLPSVIPMGIGLGLTGFPYFGSDIAGYMSQGTTPTDEELFYRWTTFGAFNPIMRTHHGRSAADNFQWENDAAATAHFKKWARFHAQLVPYLWGSSGSFERDGLSLIRLIALAYPDLDWAWTILDEYLLGDRILVAPVQKQGATSREVTLPAGSWYPMFGGSPGGAVDGGVITATADKSTIPAFVPAGALVAMYPDGVETSLPAGPTVTVAGEDREIWVYPGEARDPAHATWNDEDGPIGMAQWTWAGRPIGAGAPAAAMFEGASTTVTPGQGYVTVTVVGDGTVEFAGGGRLVIARGKPAARTTVRVY